MGTITISHYLSPCGKLIVGSHGDKLCICDWAERKARASIDNRISQRLNSAYEYGTSAAIAIAITQLDEYFAGERKEFSVPLIFTGTEFQHRVWTELLNITYGTTISYAELARRIGNPNAVRAVAAANANNPLSIFVPCHRVIGSNNTLTGYAGGLDAKLYLLGLEANADPRGL